MSAGVIAQLRPNFVLSVGAVAPLLGRDNRTFDYQLGIRGNVFFGPTARAQSAATPVSTF